MYGSDFEELLSPLYRHVSNGSRFEGQPPLYSTSAYLTPKAEK